MKKFILYTFLASIIFFGSCDLFNKSENGLSEAEIVEGLKTALKIGTDSSVTVLSAVNGYYGDNLVKIFLPPEAEPMLLYIDQIEDIAGSGYVEQTILSINRSAEEAAKEAKPIFVNAITGMSIQDGLNILQGKSTSKSDFDSIAATNYLKANTYNDLTGLYAPKIDATLDKDLLSIGLSTNELWFELIKYFNSAVDAAYILYTANELLGITTPEIIINLSQESKVNEELTLGQFATGKALDGLFYKVGEEEKKIRKNPYEWALDIIQKVFGYVFKVS